MGNIGIVESIQQKMGEGMSNQLEGMRKMNLEMAMR